MAGSEEKVELKTVEDQLGKVNELDPAKVRLNLAKWILIGVFTLIVASSSAMLFAPECRIEQAKAIFEFAKAFGPPIVTLVIGFYFRSEGST
jgi:hypothetical protein